MSSPHPSSSLIFLTDRLFSLLSSNSSAELTAPFCISSTFLCPLPQLVAVVSLLSQCKLMLDSAPNKNKTNHSASAESCSSLMFSFISLLACAVWRCSFPAPTLDPLGVSQCAPWHCSAGPRVASLRPKLGIFIPALLAVTGTSIFLTSLPSLCCPALFVLWGSLGAGLLWGAAAGGAVIP